MTVCLIICFVTNVWFIWMVLFEGQTCDACGAAIDCGSVCRDCEATR